MRKTLLFLFILSYPAMAATEVNLFELSLEELSNIKVSTPSNTSENLYDSPGTISVISKRQIESYGAGTLAEIIELSTSVFISSSYMFPGNAISIRGDIADQYNVRVLLLINGRPLRELQNGGTPFAMLNGFPVGLIQQIEIVRGPGSVLYGSGAYEGIVNIITQKTSDVEDSVSLELGSHNASGVSLYKGGTINDWDLLMGFHAFNDDGWDYVAVDEVGVSFSRSYDIDNIGFFGQLKNGGWQIDVSHADSTVGHVGTLPISSLFNTDANIQSKRSMLDIGYQHDISKQNNLHLNFTFNRLKNDYINPGPQPSFVLAEDYLAELSWHSQLTADLNVVAGASIQNVTGASAGFNEASLLHVSIIPNYDENWLRSYLELSYWLTDHFKIVTGFQANKPEDIATNLSSRLSVIYHLNDHSGIKAQYAEAFRSASLLEKSINLPGIVVGETSLDPEIKKTYDLEFFYRQLDFNLALVYYQSTSQSLITRVPDVNLGATYVNDQTAIDFNGLELEGEWHFMENYIFDYSYVWQKNESSGLDHAVATPEKMHKMGVTGEFSEKMSGGVFAFFTADWGEPLGSTTRNPDAGSFLLLNANFNYQWNTDFRLFIKVNNILDEKIYQPEYVRGNMNTLPVRDGATFMAGVKYMF